MRCNRIAINQRWGFLLARWCVGGASVQKVEALKAKVERREKLSEFKSDIDHQVQEKLSLEEQRRQREREFADQQARQQAEWKREQAQQKEADARRKEKFVVEAVRVRLPGGCSHFVHVVGMLPVPVADNRCVRSCIGNAWIRTVAIVFVMHGFVWSLCCMTRRRVKSS